MDQPDLDPVRHDEALRGLRRINALSRSSAILWPPIRRLARERGGGRTTHVLDLATGGGDVPVQLWRKARQSGVPVQMAGCDVSPRAVAHARAVAERAGAGDVHFFQHDVLQDGVPPGYDVVMHSLFLHHLSDARAQALLADMRAKASGLVLVNDLLRTRTGLALAHLAPRLLTRSPVVHVDAVLSVRAAYTRSEIARLAASAGLNDAVITRHWPERFCLCWSRAS